MRASEIRTGRFVGFKVELAAFRSLRTLPSRKPTVTTKHPTGSIEAFGRRLTREAVQGKLWRAGKPGLFHNINDQD